MKTIQFTAPVNGDKFCVGLFAEPPIENAALQAYCDRLAVLQLRHHLAAIHRAPRGPLGPFVAKVLANRSCFQTHSTRRS